MKSLFRRPDCDAAVGQKFHVQPGPAATPVELELKSITEYTTGSSEYVSYSLLLQGPADRPLDQGSYKLSNSLFPGDEVFLTAIGKAGNICSYEIIFNQLRSPDTDGTPDKELA